MEIPSLAGIELQADQPLQAQLYRHFSHCINSGSWPAGTRLPASRRIAQDLGVSRNTVTQVLHQLQKNYPDKEFVVADGCIGCRMNCPYMKCTMLEHVKRALMEEVHEIKIHPEIAQGARKALERMLAVPRDN